VAPLDFKHDTNVVDRGLKVLFFGLFLELFGLFSRCPPLKELISAIFWYFLLFFGLFPLPPPPLEKFLPTPLLVIAILDLSRLKYYIVRCC